MPSSMQHRRPYTPKKTLIALLVLAILVFFPYLRAARQQQAYHFGGETMGTFYSIRIAPSGLSRRGAQELQTRVENKLDDLSRQMSTYSPDSEISRFNDSPAGVPFNVSREFADVTAFALHVARLSGRAFEPTIKPLASLWGFGPGSDKAPHAPTDEAVRACLESVGFRLVLVTNESTLMKLHPSVSLDLNAVAKGYAVDAVAGLLRKNGCPNVFVDIGGEVMAFGSSSEGKPWRVSVEAPVRDAAPGETSMAVLELRNRAVATSGDYRNYYRDNGRAYSHIIDPRTGRPVTNRVASVSVVAPDCMTADALATALMVIGPDAAQDLLDQFPDTAAYIIERNLDGSYSEWRSEGFPGSSKGSSPSR